jgi:hypothetical protein
MRFRFKTFVALLSFTTLVATAATIGAQSLADLAKQEEARRKAIGEPAKVYTNKDLGAPPASTPPPSATPAPSTPSAGDEAKVSNKDKGRDKNGTEQGAVKDQAYWAGRQKAIHEQIDRDQAAFDVVQSRLNALNSGIVNRDDPAQGALLERDRQKALAELSRLKLELQQSKKALTDFEEEARRAGVPPGWLR